MLKIGGAQWGAHFVRGKSSIKLNQNEKVIIIQTTPTMFFSIDPQNMMCQTANFNYLPFNFVYFVPNPPNFEKDPTSETNIAEKDLSRAQCCPKPAAKAQKKIQKPALKKLVLKRTQTPKLIQQDITETSKVPPVKKPKQNAQRNILPNIVHQIFCFVQKQKRSGHIVRQYLDNEQIPQSQKFSFERFYLYQRLIRDKINNYINMRGLIELNRFQEPQFEIYSQMEQVNFIRMNRILLRHFLLSQFDSIVLTSTRMLGQTRLWHFQLKRRIMDELNEHLAGV